jgi:type IV secretory pathway TraG/TraD family ATPase VirD4
MLKKAIISLAVFVSLLAMPHTASASTRIVLSAVTLAKWQKVAICEEGGNWKYFSYWYPDALGIDRPNWIQFGGSITRASTRAQQILVAERFVKHYKIGVPDQYGCHSW